MGSCQSTSTLDQRTDDNFGCSAMRQVKPFLWRGDLGINCGDLRRFGVICGDLRWFAANSIGDMFLLPNQILGGAQPPGPLFLWKTEIGGPWPPSPPENMFSGFHQPNGDTLAARGLEEPCASFPDFCNNRQFPVIYCVSSRLCTLFQWIIHDFEE